MRAMRWEKTLSVVLVSFAVATTAACTKVKNVPVIDDKTPLPRPADVILEASMPSLATIADLKAYVDHVKPGFGPLLDSKARYMVADLGGLSNLDGVKADAPVWAVVLNPKPKGQRSVLVFTVGDEKKLAESAKNTTYKIQDGHAVVGSKESVEALGPYAFATIAKQKAPAVATVQIFVPVLRTAFHDEIEQGKKAIPAMMSQAGPAAAKVVQLEVDGAFWLLEATDVFEVRLEPSADDLSLELAVVPHAGNGMAEFIAAQKPATTGLLDRLPAFADPMIVGAGGIYLGPTAAAAKQVCSEMILSFIGAEKNEKLTAAVTDLIDSGTGNFAVVGSFGGGGLRLHELVSISDAQKAMKAMGTFVDLVSATPPGPAVGGMKISYAPWKQAAIDGVPVVGYTQTIDVSGIPPEQVAAMKRSGLGTTSSSRARARELRPPEAAGAPPGSG
jgi:hypothetical protein